MEKSVIKIKENLPKDAVVWFTNNIKICKDTAISVPMYYKAFAICDEKVVTRIDSCSEKNICKEINKGFKDKNIRFAYAIGNQKFNLLWGLGDVKVNNERLQEAYRVGMNGTCSVEIQNYGNLMKNFFIQEDIVTIDDIKKEILPIIKNIGKSILSDYFASSNISVFEIESKTNEIRNKIYDVLKKEKSIQNAGLQLNDFIVEGINVNEDDLEVIMNRLNSSNKGDE